MIQTKGSDLRGVDSAASAESDDDVDRMAQPFFQWIEEMQAGGRYDVIAYLRDLEDDDL